MQGYNTNYMVKFGDVGINQYFCSVMIYTTIMDIKKTIKDKGYTISLVAEKMGINRVTLTNMISGNPTYNTMSRVAEAIGCSVVDFFSDERTDNKADFAAFVRYNGIHYTADTLEEFNTIVEEIRSVTN